MNPHGFRFSEELPAHSILPEPERSIARLKDQLRELQALPRNGTVRLEMAKCKVYLKQLLRAQATQSWTFHFTNDSSNSQAECKQT